MWNVSYLDNADKWFITLQECQALYNNGRVSVALFLNADQFSPSTEVNLHTYISLLGFWQDFCFYGPIPQFFEIVFACGILRVGDSIIFSYKQIYFCFKILILNLLADIWKHNHAPQFQCFVCNWSNLSDSGALWPGMKPESGLTQTPSPSQHSVLTCTTGLTTSQPSPAHYSYPIQGKQAWLCVFCFFKKIIIVFCF